MTRLSVNVDHVATLRQARGTPYPDPAEAAKIAEKAGAHGITLHLRADRRHVQDHDLAKLKDTVVGKLNLEISVAEEMVDIALDRRPDQVTLVPERPDEVTTEGGLDLARNGGRVRDVAERLVGAGIDVSAFLDPDPVQIGLLEQFAGGIVHGFEINTDAYTKTPGDEELAKIRQTAVLGAERGFRVYAGHGLTPGNTGPVAAVEPIEELNIGHGLISRAVLVGMEAAVREYLAVFPD